MRQPLFYHFRPLILASKFNHQIMFFQSSFLELLFLIVFIFFRNGRFWDPHSKSDGIKNGCKIYHVVEMLYNFLFPATASFQTVFSRNHSNYLSLWDIVAFERSFFRWRLATFLFLLYFFVLCFI